MFDGNDELERAEKLIHEDQLSIQMITDYQTEIGELEILRLEAEECNFVIQKCELVLRHTRLPLVKADMLSARRRAEAQRERIRDRIIEIRTLQDSRW